MSPSLIEHWNGSTWSVMPSPNPKGAVVTSFGGISCTGTQSCFAVGGYFGNTSGGALVERWNGVHWSIVKVPQPAFPFAKGRSRLAPRSRGRDTVTVTFDIEGGFNGVSCASPQSCVAVGSGFNGPLIERWNGTKWSIATSPAPPTGNGAELDAVSCAERDRLLCGRRVGQ